MIIGGLRPGNPQTNRPSKLGANVQETMVGSTALLYISIGTNLFITCGVSKVREIPHENAWFWEIETHGYSKQTYLGWPVFPRNFSQLLSFSSLWTVEKIPKKKEHVMQNLLQCGARCDFCQGNPFVLLQDGMEAFRLLFSLQMFQGFLARSNDFVGCRIGHPQTTFRWLFF